MTLIISNKHVPGQGGDIRLDLLEHLLLLLERLGGLDHLVVRLVKSNLQLLHFLTIVTDVTVSLIYR